MRHTLQFIAIHFARALVAPKVHFNANPVPPKEPTMTSRLTAIALIFAVFSTASLAFATTLHHDAQTKPAAQQVRVVELERVVITAKRLPREVR